MEALKRLGFNSLEAEVYLFLLANEPRTAYKIGKALGKPTANVYKAMESLARKGAVLIEEGKNRLCAAVPFEEFLRVLESEFKAHTAQAHQLLRHLEVAPEDERIYQIQSLPLILERCRSMLAAAETVVVLDIFPKLLARLLEDVRAVAARGVKVVLQAYEPVHVEGAQVAIPQQTETILNHWRSQQVNLMVDGREHLIALVGNDLKTVYQAIWSRSLYLSCMLHASFCHEHLVHRLMAVRDDADAMRRLLEKPPFFINTEVPGRDDLFRRFMTLPEDEGSL